MKDFIEKTFDLPKLSIKEIIYPFRNSNHKRRNNLTAIPKHLKRIYLLLIGARSIHIPKSERICR